MRKEAQRFLVVELAVHLSDFGPFIQNYKNTSLRVI